MFNIVAILDTFKSIDDFDHLIKSRVALSN